MSEKFAKRIFKPARIRYKGLVDFDSLYKMMHGWFGGREYDFIEKRFKRKARSEGDEFEINWEAWREINTFMQNWITVYFHVWEYKEIEVIKDGKKKKIGRCRMLIDFKFWIELDYENHWEDTRLKRAMRDFYVKFVIRHDLSDVHWDKLWYNVNKLQQETKKHLGMESHSDVYDDMW